MDRCSPRGSYHTHSHQVGLQLAGKASAGTLIRRAEGFREPNENPRTRWNRDRVALRRSGISGGDNTNPVHQDTESEYVDHAGQSLNQGCFHKMSSHTENSSATYDYLIGNAELRCRSLSDSNWLSAS